MCFPPVSFFHLSSFFESGLNLKVLFLILDIWSHMKVLLFAFRKGGHLETMLSNVANLGNFILAVFCILHYFQP